MDSIGCSSSPKTHSLTPSKCVLTNLFIISHLFILHVDVCSLLCCSLLLPLTFRLFHFLLMPTSSLSWCYCWCQHTPPPLPVFLFLSLTRFISTTIGVTALIERMSSSPSSFILIPKLSEVISALVLSLSFCQLVAWAWLWSLSSHYAYAYAYVCACE